MAQSKVKHQLAALVGKALESHRGCHFAEAEAIYRQVLAVDPKNADALHLLGCLFDEMGRPDEAIDFLTQAVNCNPLAYPYFYNLANMLAKQDRLCEAVSHYGTAIRLKPDYAVAYNNLGLVLARQGEHTQARAYFQKAIKLKADYADPLYNLGRELKAVGELDGAITAYREAIRIQPAHADACYNLGNACSLAQRLEEAINAYQQAARIEPDNAKIYTNMGGALMKLGRLEEASVNFQKALRLDPADVLTYSNLILAASYVSADPAAMHTHCAQWESIHGFAEHGVPVLHSNTRDPERRLRIGYVSADFRAHAAAYWIEPLLEAHDRQACEIVCYSNGVEVDTVTERLKGLADAWVDCAALSDDALAERIRCDAIDILVDLSGHTSGNRLPVFARQPAPVQVSWFGFPVSTGLKAMNYRFTDAIIDPEGINDPFYSEKLIRLPRFYAAFRPDSQAPEPGVGPVARQGYVTFASFNNFAKITRPMLELWAEILHATPNSRLLLQSAGLDGPELGHVLRSFFTENGIAPERLILRGWTDLKAYLSLGAEADIALDPYPFNGGVTTCHALWMGLPVVSLSGQSAASRVGRSLLTRIGHPELVAESAVQYRDIAVALAHDRGRLAALRSSLRSSMATGGLLDGVGLARDVEAAYRTMWRAWCDGPG